MEETGGALLPRFFSKLQASLKFLALNVGAAGLGSELLHELLRRAHATGAALPAEARKRFFNSGAEGIH